MPHGKAEDWLLIDFRDKLLEVRNDDSVDMDRLWEEFRQRVHESLDEQAVTTDMGMDVGI